MPKILTGFEPDAGPRYRFRTQLPAIDSAGATVQRAYLFDVHWNTREGAWYFDLLLADETPVVSGVKVVLGALLGGRCMSRDFPAGVIIAEDLTHAGREATLDDLGSRVLIYFYSDVTPADLAGAT